MEKDKQKSQKSTKTEIIEVEVMKTPLETLKESYEVLKKEYSLPKFEEINKDFSIEKINEEETDYLIREIRRYISEKINGYLRLTETLIHPTNAQMFVFTMLKSMSKDDSKKLQDIYKRLAEKEIDVIELDLAYNLKKEVEFIKSAFSMWQGVKHDLLELIAKIKKDWKTANNKKTRERDYFG